MDMAKIKVPEGFFDWKNGPKHGKSLVFIKFTGAKCTYEDNGDRTLTPWSPIWINVEKICGFYDHTILVNGQKIRVMETEDQIVNSVWVVATLGEGVQPNDQPEQDEDADRV